MNDTLREFLNLIGPWPQRTVCLMGIGPGDPGLITVKGALRLSEADVVVYESANPPAAIWTLIQPWAVKLYVGRDNNGARVEVRQMVEKIRPYVRDGKRVAIVKTGDPMVFNRGEQDARALADRGIAFEIIPAPTAALAAAAYAGIPITDRHRVDAISLAIGKAGGSEGVPEPDLPALARSGTLAVYMGEENFESLCERLITGGLAAETAVTVVENATRSNQRTIRGTLQTISAQGQEAGIQKPAVIFVGNAAGGDEDLCWFNR